MRIREQKLKLGPQQQIISNCAGFCPRNYFFFFFSTKLVDWSLYKQDGQRLALLVEIHSFTDSFCIMVVKGRITRKGKKSKLN